MYNVKIKSHSEQYKFIGKGICACRRVTIQPHFDTSVDRRMAQCDKKNSGDRRPLKKRACPDKAIIGGGTEKPYE